MSDYIDFKIFSPKGELLERKADFIKLKSASGDLGILTGHTTLISNIE